MSQHETASAGARTPREASRLSRLQFAVILGAVVVFFLIGRGPVWHDPFDYYKLAGSIIWSYVPIPFLVVAFLAASRKLTVVSWLVETSILTVVKFGVTASIMVVIWAVSGPPPPNAMARKPLLFELIPAPKPAPLPPVVPAEAGRVTGSVTDAAGKPVSALVWLDGVPPRTFATRTDTIVLSDAGSGPMPAVAAVQVGQPLVGRSLDGRLHTLMGTRPDGRTVFNRPMLAPEHEHPLALSHVLGEVIVRCTAHPAERPARLLVLSHPFFVATGEDGTFTFDGVPAGRIAVVAMTEGLAARRPADLTPRGALRADVSLEQPARATP